MKSEKGQGLLEYGIILLPIIAGAIVFVAVLMFADQAWAWFTGVIAGVMAGEPASIAIAVVVLFVALYIIFRRRKSK